MSEKAIEIQARLVKMAEYYKLARLVLSLVTLLLAVFFLTIGYFEIAVISALAAIWMKISI